MITTYEPGQRLLCVDLDRLREGYQTQPDYYVAHLHTPSRSPLSVGIARFEWVDEIPEDDKIFDEHGMDVERVIIPAIEVVCVLAGPLTSK